jgi:hypothetical protein
LIFAEEVMRCPGLQPRIAGAERVADATDLLQRVVHRQRHQLGLLSFVFF